MPASAAKLGHRLESGTWTCSHTDYPVRWHHRKLAWLFDPTSKVLVMIQVALLIVAIALIILGIKGFSASGIPFSKTVTLSGTPGKIVGVICILAGVMLIPLFMLIIWSFSG